jgi:hypothetical protein
MMMSDRTFCAAASYSIEGIPSQSDKRPWRGIYAIRNRVTGNFYIGSSEHMIRRIRRHVSLLRRGIHHSIRLRNFSDEHCAALSLAAKFPKPWASYPRSEAERARLSISAKKKFERGFVNATTRGVQVNGKIYDSGKVAAAALGVSHQTLIARIKRGYGRYLDEPDNGNGSRVMPDGGANVRAVVIAGTAFPSLAAAASHFSMTAPGINYWIKTGRAQYAGAVI